MNPSSYICNCGCELIFKILPGQPRGCLLQLDNLTFILEDRLYNDSWYNYIGHLRTWGEFKNKITNKYHLYIDIINAELVRNNNNIDNNNNNIDNNNNNIDNIDNNNNNNNNNNNMSIRVWLHLYNVYIGNDLYHNIPANTVMNFIYIN